MDPSTSNSSDPAPATSTSTSTPAPQAASAQPPTPPASQSGADSKMSDSARTSGATTPPFSPASTTPVLEKDNLDFSGNVEVNDDIPTEDDFKRVEDFLVLDHKGGSRPFKDLYSGEGGTAARQLIIFVRHFFCGNCQEYLRTLSSSVTSDDLIKLDEPAFITVIGCGRPELIDMYAQTTGCPFPIYADPSRKLYDYLGMTRTLDMGKKPEYIQSNMLLTSMQSIVQGIKTGNKALKGGDLKQVGGEFLFQDGRCVWVHRMRNTRDHAEVPHLRRLLGLDDTKPPLRKRWSHGIKNIKEKQSASWGRGRSKSKVDKEGSKTPEQIEEEEVLRPNAGAGQTAV